MIASARVVVLDDGTIQATGTAEQVITADMLREAYRVDATVHRTPDGTLTLAVSGARPDVADDSGASQQADRRSSSAAGNGSGAAVPR
ncbi:hypothetical protein [Nocardia alni]|uniref:hypothetical protein n=1 Tax=Nocardia alni TaxID=2815723 RepID=UPI001C218BC1|nr:hypothetical protein [Nocardia alni]